MARPATTKTVLFSAELRDEDWLQRGGQVFGYFRDTRLLRLVLNFTKLRWADPTPLLTIACLAAERSARGQQTYIDLGHPRDSTGNQFLMFLARHGFLAALAPYVVFRWRNAFYDTSALPVLEAALRGLHGLLAYRDAECVPATVCLLGGMDEAALDGLVERLVASARPRIASWVSANARRRGLILHRLRVILTEALDNIAEHAYQPRRGEPDKYTVPVGAVYARIRSGAPYESIELVEWERVRRGESSACPTLSRSTTRKRPGWLEIFVCDVGYGLTHHLSDDQRSPLQILADRLFRESVSRFRDRPAARKTSVTGLQRMGRLLTAGVAANDRGGFVRVYSSGEWVGEHLPWPKAPDHRNVRNEYDVSYPLGSVLHFAIEPPPAEAQSQLQLYPPDFLVPNREELAAVRDVLRDSGPALFAKAVSFADLYVFGGDPDAGWEASVDRSVVFIRPSRTQRKISLIEQLARLGSLPQASVTDIVLADVPWSAAIDFAHVIKGERASHRWGRRSINIYVLSQDWACAAYSLGGDPLHFAPNMRLARHFLTAGPEHVSAALVADALRQRDTELFWRGVGDAYLSEEVRWNDNADQEANIIRGYLDVALAISRSEPYEAARRALRRAVSAFAEATVYAADELVNPLVYGEFAVEDAAGVVGSDQPSQGVLASSVLGTGSTTRRFLMRRGAVQGAAHLLKHPDLRGSPELEAVLALQWRPTSTTARPRKGGLRGYERIPNTPFIIRGGESAIPLPRFREPVDGKLGASLYGESPGQAYERWQQLGLLRLGHWTYSGHHDLLTLRLMDALEFDEVEGGPIVQWFAQQILQWRNSAVEERRGCFVVYPQHVTTDRLVRSINSVQELAGLRFIPLPIPRAWAKSPIVISPMTRSLIGRLLSAEFKSGGRVIFLDDGIVSGGTLSQVTQALEGLWEVLKRVGEVEVTASLTVCSLAMVDRSGLPTQRALVVRDIDKHRRFWRWDVPPLGQDGTCPLCALRERWREMRPIFESESLRQRTDQWQDQWRAVSVEDGRFEAGSLPRTMPAGDFTRFAVERIKGRRRDVSDVVHHKISTSRASIAAELARSTTRKDYPLRKAAGEKGTADVPLDILTRIEILVCQLLLYQEELSAADRSERMRVLLDLLWLSEEPSTTTALAAMTLELDPTLATELWQQCFAKVDAVGFPHADAVISAIALHSTAGRPPFEGKHSDWELFELCRQPPERYREPLARLFRVIGWDPFSAHRSLLADLLISPEITPRMLYQGSLMMEGLGNALSSFRPAIFEGTDLRTDEDAKRLQAVAESMRAAAVSSDVDRASQAQGAAQSGDKAGVSPMIVVRAAYELLFAHQGLRIKYTSALTRELETGQAAEFLLSEPLRAIEASWTNILQAKGPQIGRRWSEPPRFEFASVKLSKDRTTVYFDANIRRAIADLLSNVMHRAEPIECPWPEFSILGTADMWGRITEREDGDAIVLELINKMDDPKPFQPQNTSSLSHLAALGGSVSAHVCTVTSRATMQVEIPTVRGLAKT